MTTHQTSNKRGPYKRGLTRQRLILDSAVTLLIDDGFHNFSLRKVAKKNGISPGNLQHYFPTKEKLVEAMLDKIIQGYLEQFQTIREHSGTPKEQFENVIHHVISDLNNRTTAIFFPELWSLANHEEEINKLMEKMYSQYRKLLADIISEVNPKLNQTQIDRAALFICSSIEGHTVSIGHLKPWKHETQNVIKMATDCFLHMVERGDIPD